MKIGYSLMLLLSIAVPSALFSAPQDEEELTQASSSFEDGFKTLKSLFKDVKSAVGIVPQTETPAVAKPLDDLTSHLFDFSGDFFKHVADIATAARNKSMSGGIPDWLQNLIEKAKSGLNSLIAVAEHKKVAHNSLADDAREALKSLMHL